MDTTGWRQQDSNPQSLDHPVLYPLCHMPHHCAHLIFNNLNVTLIICKTGEVSILNRISIPIQQTNLPIRSNQTVSSSSCYIE